MTDALFDLSEFDTSGGCGVTLWAGSNDQIELGLLKPIMSLAGPVGIILLIAILALAIRTRKRAVIAGFAVALSLFTAMNLLILCGAIDCGPQSEFYRYLYLGR